MAAAPLRAGGIFVAEEFEEGRGRTPAQCQSDPPRPSGSAGVRGSVETAGLVAFAGGFDIVFSQVPELRVRVKGLWVYD